VRYSLDTSAILDGWRRHYPVDTFPGLWDNLASLINKGDLRATEVVSDELKKQDDELLDWCVKQSSLFVSIDGPVQSKVAEILSKHPNLVNAGKGRSGADPFVIALAEIHGATVITGEVITAKSKMPRIPDVCEERGVAWGNLLFLIKQEKWTF